MAVDSHVLGVGTGEQAFRSHREQSLQQQGSVPARACEVNFDIYLQYSQALIRVRASVVSTLLICTRQG